MQDTRHKIWLTLIVAGAAAGLYYGWRQFWFMTDDAYIAFRYVSNSLLGYGYVWNPPPFHPVEGYTSFLWVLLHDIIWRLTGLTPPRVTNYLTLLFSALTLGLIGWVVLRMKLSRPLARYRLLFLALILLGTLTNRTFLAWTSSGLETAMFNFFLSAWLVIAIRGRLTDARWLAYLTGAASLVYLTRPDGLLPLAVTLGLVTLAIVQLLRERYFAGRHLLAILPLLIAPIHLVWRLATYGEWLPNTYYAKHLGAWPEAGLRYFTSFALEYGLIVWLLVLILTVWFGRGLFENTAGANEAKASDDRWLRLVDGLSRQAGPLAVAAVVAGQVGYYTLIIGGDHFEYRVYSYLIPWLFVSFVWMLNRITRDWVIAAVSCAVFILVSWPIPWVHWAHSQDLTTRDETHVMKVPVAEFFPPILDRYVAWFDSLQNWLIEHHVCMRHQEHKVFQAWFASQFPERSYEMIPQAGEYPTMAYGSVGVPGWVFPHICVIDMFGLNDYIIARYSPTLKRERKMAHDRYGPEGYRQSWAINYGFLENGTTGFVRRDYELTAEDIRSNESYWIDRVINGIDRPMPYDMLCRIGETENLHGTQEEAMYWFSRAIGRDSTRLRALVGLAQSVSGLNRFDSARILLERGLEFDSKNVLILSRLGVAEANLGYADYPESPEDGRAHFDAARDYLGRALAQDSCRSETLTELASIHIFLDQLDSSYIYLDRLIDCPHSSPSFLHLLGQRYVRKGDYDAALTAYALAIRNGLNYSRAQQLVADYPSLQDMIE